jgi:hypothetical protein
VSELPDEQAGPTCDKPAWRKKRRGFRVCVRSKKERPQISPLLGAFPSDPRKLRSQIEEYCAAHQPEATQRKLERYEHCGEEESKCNQRTDLCSRRAWCETPSTTASARRPEVAGKSEVPLNACCLAADRALTCKCSKSPRLWKVTLSIADISLPSTFDSSLAAELTGVTPITAITSGPDSNTSGNSRDTPAQESHTPEDDSGAKSDLSGSNANLKGQADPTLSNDLGSDLASLLKDLTSGNTSAAKADVSKVQADLQTQDTSSVADTQTGSTLDALIGKISDSLNAGSVQGAPQDGAQHDLATFLVDNGQGTGSLINTSA